MPNAKPSRPTPRTAGSRTSGQPTNRGKSIPRYAVIMAGGHGTRFWPRSRQRVPKQLLRLTGRRSLLQDTARRLRRAVPWSRMLVVTNQGHAAEVRRQLPRLRADQVLVEPRGRNTLPCIGLAAEWIAKREPEALMVVAPADHVIGDIDGWCRSIDVAIAVAVQQAALVTIGVPPTRAETGYGYIEVGKPLQFAGAAPANRVKLFREKPAPAVAARFVRSGRFLWNSGMFVWRLSSIRRAIDVCAPEVSRALRGVWAGRNSRTHAALVQRAYRRLASQSIDVGVLEVVLRRDDAPSVAVVRAAFDWNDIGSWGALPELWGCDADGNAMVGRTVAIDSRGSVVFAPERLIALVGLRDVIVVDSGDAVLICARDRAQDVRQVTDELRRRGWKQYL